MRSVITMCILLLSGSILLGQEQDKNIILESKGIKNWTASAFTLDHDLVLSIVATGQTLNEQWAARAWIIDSNTRQPVWEMNNNNTKSINNEGRKRFMGDLLFPEGTYEVYYGIDAAVLAKNKGLSKFIDDLFDNLEYYDKDTKHWGVKVRPLPEDENYFHDLDIDQVIPSRQPVLALTGVGDNAIQEAAFTLEQDTPLHIYMIGEGMIKSNRFYDYGWITDQSNRQRVWQADLHDSQFAGGADKNRMIDTDISLPAGSYTLHYITDDSHSPDQFNQMPPWDPRHWGISLYGDPGLVRVEQKQTRNNADIAAPVLRIDRVGNNAFYCDGFEIHEPAKIHITAEGEYSRMFNGFVDYGWIINARTRKMVWSMTLDNTHHAGGSQKNKIAEETIELEPGAYKVCYVSDDSHAWNSWNSTPPLEPDLWGITIRPADDKQDQPEFLPYSEDKDPAFIASLKEVGNQEHRRKTFTLTERTQIRIYALGEGDAEGMYDYGWIDNSNGETVWKMKYRETVHAGGARKNRLVNTLITLDAGQYTLHYISDDSHSFDSWNSPRPDDFAYWGITLIKVE